MRGGRACKSCMWFENKSEEFKERFVPFDGMCNFRMPASIAKDSQGWGSWHQKGPAAVRFEDWCSCYGALDTIEMEHSGPRPIAPPIINLSIGKRP